MGGLLVAAMGGQALAVTTVVTGLGPAGWVSGDSRADGHVDVNGNNQLVSGRNAVEDGLIADRLEFVNGPPVPSMGTGSVHFETPVNNDKATLENRGVSNNFLTDSFDVEYAWYRAPGGGVAAPAFKIGIDTNEANPVGPKAVDRGEDRFDKILVYEPYQDGAVVTSDNVWTTENINGTTGGFWMVNLTGGSALPGTVLSPLRTLDEWQLLFNSTAGITSATINSIQLGVGSFNANQDSHVDYLTYNVTGAAAPQENTWDFEAATQQPAVPEPVTAGLGVLGLAAIGLVTRRRKS